LRFDELQREINAREEQFLPFGVGVSGLNGGEVTSHFFNGGVKPTRKIRTRLGYEIEGSTKHPLLTLRDGRTVWTRLEDVRVGDAVALQRGQNLFGTTTKFPPYLDTGTASRGLNRKLTLPVELTADLSRLLGYITAEGSLTDTALWITNGHPRVVEDVWRRAKNFSMSVRKFIANRARLLFQSASPRSNSCAGSNKFAACAGARRTNSSRAS
jgi:hypothetical protein